MMKQVEAWVEYVEDENGRVHCITYMMTAEAIAELVKAGVIGEDVRPVQSLKRIAETIVAMHEMQAITDAGGVLQ